MLPYLCHRISLIAGDGKDRIVFIEHFKQLQLVFRNRQADRWHAETGTFETVCPATSYGQINLIK